MTAPARTAGARAWALAGTALIAGGVVAVLALHVITRYASLLAFFCLPAAALALGRAWRGDARWGALAGATWWLGVASLGWLVPSLLGFVLRPLTGVPWWQFVPLGLFERGLASTEVAALLVMGVWAARRQLPTS